MNTAAGGTLKAPPERAVDDLDFVDAVAEDHLLSLQLARPRTPTAGPLSSWYSDLGRLDRVLNPTLRTSRLVCGGRAVEDPTRARRLAVLEALEREAWVLGSRLPMISCSFDEIDELAADPELFASCSGSEGAAPNFSAGGRRGMRRHWVKGVRLPDLTPAWVPAAAAVMAEGAITYDEQLGPNTTTGCAVHSTLEAAVAAGMCEVIERDALTTFWLLRRPAPPLDRVCVDDDTRRLIEWSDEHFVNTRLYDLTSDFGVPTVYAVQVAPHDPAVRHVVGCAAAEDPLRAARQAVMEAIDIRWGLLSDSVPARAPGHFNDIADGARWTGHPDRASASAWMEQGELAPSRPSLSGPVKDAASRAGLDAYFVDLTTPVLRTHGLHAVHVIVPAAQPLSFDPDTRFLGNERLRGLMALAPSVAEEDLNPYPQPFA